MEALGSRRPRDAMKVDQSRFAYFALVIYLVGSLIATLSRSGTSVLPFVAWNMFNVPNSVERAYFLTIEDSNGQWLCESPSCPQIYGQNQLRIYLWTQHLGRAIEANQPEIAQIQKNRILINLRPRADWHLVLKKLNLDWADRGQMKWHEAQHLAEIQ